MKFESVGHPIIGHYVIGALVMKKSMSCEVAPTYVMTIIVRPLTGSPLAPRFARPLAQLAVLTCERPRWGLALSSET